MKNVLSRYWYIALLAIGLLIYFIRPQEKPLDVEAIVAREVDNRIATFKKKRQLKCKKEMMEEAIAMVDSLVQKQASLLIKPQQLDVLKPQKPKAPIIDAPVDTVPLEPLWKAGSRKE